MTTDELMAKADSIFTIEKASSLALQALCEVAPPDVVRMTWLMAYCKGRSDAFSESHTMYTQARHA